MDNISQDVIRVLNIGIELSAKRNMSKLFDTIITEAMLITNCDGGTLYIYENEMLHFKIMRNHTLKTYKGGKDEKIDLPPVPITKQNVCSYVVLCRELKNIDDLYFSDEFDFSGPKKYDAITGYRTKSMLVIPLENNKGEIVGVLQLINALDENRNVISFSKKFELIFRSIAAQAAIAVTNMKYTRDIKNLFNSLVQVLAAAIDERTPYNANHTKNVVLLLSDFIDFLNKKYYQGTYDQFIDEELREQIIMAAWLHDVGKIITPLEIMDKATRLGACAEIVSLRLTNLYYSEQIKYLQGSISASQWEEVSAQLKQAKDLCEKSNTGAVMADEEIELIKSYSKRKTITTEGQEIFWLTDPEVEQLSLKYGTLTQNERKIMEEHVVITDKLLKKIEFTKEYKDVPFFAASHHEKLNGKGYPKGLKLNEMPLATRLLVMMDIFEALTANDRPYRKAMSTEKAFEILEKMVEDGDLDSNLVALLKEHKLNL